MTGSTSLADMAAALYGAGVQLQGDATMGTPPRDSLVDGTVDSTLAGALQQMVDGGAAEHRDVVALGRQLTREAAAVGLKGYDASSAFDAINEQADPARDQAEKGRTVAWLRSEFGEQTETQLDAINAWLRQTAPGVAQVLATSSAGNRLEIVQRVVREFQRVHAR